ncbi:MAG: UDP-N-acetylmuramoyl-tripeptide--D-alanyl-D-alanine ligase [Chloroflexi bacterium]|jgi:UDP-N-acetylmuramoyl-tripeptide--D-alanyl-D-alanine ligase|nr:UDP-N-acetylmuramoyl-tripeptide--D-alanyl-D-alanine ligase [Chloroflexota bacterium]MBT3670726.1 UDP-N-acetylmuramoyl-tripeptide--D-alanyl-D-alanine ligase [Chloroflexota bacterium]MBT4305095.1 UDP-N-acetylmuramoyl-tripeptide--D-alanyl-D-alanine ligase [Chloroflexota bacterium]MBT4533384.1 UDP-N-acetylmuramoyl-tripeptide--D-alanyl-D-alanine ligase [Chloroflexota bacterium]MBT4682860.1 UDP-N-acetylmuramoyl-tripeptide--D-alanyl-D-alanine ligase [Chloroflexota bacterium]
MLTLADLIQALTNSAPNNASQEIPEAVIDSRKVSPGSLFIALPGENVDGHDFVSNAFENKANFALIDKDLSAQFRVLDLTKDFDPEMAELPEMPFCIRVPDSLSALQKIAAHWRNELDIKVIGITGSVGKSTTKEIIADVLRQRYKTHKNLGNFNNEIGLPLSILGLRKSHQRAILEMGFYVPGEIKFLCEIAQPTIGVITNIGTVHAERAGSQDEIAKGKSELVEYLPEHGFAILNYDDPLVRPMAEKTKAKVIFYGLSPQADLWADEITSLGLKGIRFRLNYKNDSIYLSVPMLGQHSVHTAMRATAVGLADGLTWQEIVSGLKFNDTQFRLVAVKAAIGATLIDDTYNASPQSTLAALNLLEDLGGRKVAVLGDMLELGQYEQAGHEQVGIRAASVADELIVIGERAKTIAKVAQAHGFPEEKITQLATAEQAIEVLRDHLQKEDSVLIKGSRGMKMDVIAPALEKAE